MVRFEGLSSIGYSNNLYFDCQLVTSNPVSSLINKDNLLPDSIKRLLKACLTLKTSVLSKREDKKL